MTNRKLIAGNWKMNGLLADGLELAGNLAGRFKPGVDDGFDMLICPPATLIAPIKTVVGDNPVHIGGQDCSHCAPGAHTGDISPDQLKDLGCAYVILGHSERRKDHRESSELVNLKVKNAHKNGLVAIVCVGELEAEREAGREKEVVSEHLDGSLPEGCTPENTVIAYEPVWAIGTGKTATPSDVRDMHAFIREHIKGLVADSDKMRILYGGSVNAANAAELLNVPNVDGALVGGASLKANDFWLIATDWND
ncbi:MAG: triose-phosphate isomerase [Pseudomonadota bacterium]|nr:triose-phosphate isomerase [Pseudomonadota bacterium]